MAWTMAMPVISVEKEKISYKWICPRGAYPIFNVNVAGVRSPEGICPWLAMVWLGRWNLLGTFDDPCLKQPEQPIFCLDRGEKFYIWFFDSIKVEPVPPKGNLQPIHIIVSGTMNCLNKFTKTVYVAVSICSGLLDVNNDDNIDLLDAIYILQVLSGLRQ